MATLLLAANFAIGATVEFSWSSAGSGSYTTTVPGQGSGSGEMVTLTGVMSAPVVTNNDPGLVPVGYDQVQSVFVATANNVTVASHFGWSGTTTLTGIDLQGNSYSLLVDLTYEVGDFVSYGVTVVDELAFDAGGDDVIGNVQFAIWPGDNGGGNRVSGQTVTFLSGADSFQVSGSRTFGETNTANSIGDDLGFIIGARDSGGVLPNGTLLFSDTTFSGTLNEDSLVEFSPVPEPSSSVLIGFGLLGAIARRRRA
ncbi:PEP-CTERM sorting domain-containing protein [Haloferula chungangensis]|uniref:PEP-CTERM sorting domain-containing protein n=1 Tax=Haloferula chungangensis TaxID=1048331 RepID=A0ABW2L5V8_9BACT